MSVSVLCAVLKGTYKFHARDKLLALAMWCYKHDKAFVCLCPFFAYPDLPL
jgi:hypothetical protein